MSKKRARLFRKKMRELSLQARINPNPIESREWLSKRLTEALSDKRGVVRRQRPWKLVVHLANGKIEVREFGLRKPIYKPTDLNSPWKKETARATNGKRYLAECKRKALK